MIHGELTDILGNKRCLVCQGCLKRVDTPKSPFKSAPLSPPIRFECALSGYKHYVAHLNETGSKIEEEILTIVLNKKEHSIIQYWDNYDIVITIFDEDGRYSSSKEFSMPTLAFDFLNDDLVKNVNRLKTILTFQ